MFGEDRLYPVKNSLSLFHDFSHGRKKYLNEGQTYSIIFAVLF